MTQGPILVTVRRQPGDWRVATYDLRNVSDLRWHHISGGVQHGSAMHVYGYVLCDGMIDGELAAFVSPPPHRIKVCVTKKYNEHIWPEILKIVGPKPCKGGLVEDRQNWFLLTKSD
jgi:hypothetical protein